MRTTVRVRTGLIITFSIGLAVALHARQTTGVCLSGQVLGDDAKGLGGAGLKLRLQGTTNFISISTDAEGRFSLATCAPGWYDLSATHIDYPTTVYGAKPGTDGTPLVLGRTPVTGLKVQLASAGVITGVVKKQNGEGIAGVEVRAGVRVIDANGNVGYSSGRTTVTDKQGEYRLAALPAGRYFVSTVKTLVSRDVGYPAQAHAETFHPSALNVEDARWLDVASGQTVTGADIVPQPEPTGQFERATTKTVAKPGKVSDPSLIASGRTASIVGNVTDSSGAPATDYTVVVFPADKALWAPSLRRNFGVRPANTGEFRVQNVPAGNYRVAVVKDAIWNAWQVTEFLESIVGASTPVTVADNVANGPVRLVVR